MVSDDIVHGKYAVWTFLKKKMFADLCQRHPDIHIVQIVSDGSAAQFKNRFTIFNLTCFQYDFNLKATWSFLATSHGKGVVYGVGGTVKQAVANAVLRRKFVLTNFEEFANCAQSVLSNTYIHHIAKRESEFNKTMSERWKNLLSILKIQGSHYFEPVSQSMIRYGPTATSQLITFNMQSTDQTEDSTQLTPI